jgi:hypothetical protein
VIVQRRAGVDISRLIPRTDDPPADPDATLIYVRIVEGQGMRMLARFPNGIISVIL